MQQSVALDALHGQWPEKFTKSRDGRITIGSRFKILLLLNIFEGISQKALFQKRHFYFSERKIRTQINLSHDL